MCGMCTLCTKIGLAKRKKHIGIVLQIQNYGQLAVVVMRWPTGSGLSLSIVTERKQAICGTAHPSKLKDLAHIVAM